MKKIIAAFALTAAVATPAFASDGSEAAMHASVQPGYVATSNGMDSYAFAPRANWQNANNGQWQAQSPIIDR